MGFGISETVNTDILVIGGGLAAIKAAYEAGKSGLKVLVAEKSRLCSGSSFSPFTSSLGCQCPIDDNDSEVFHKGVQKDRRHITGPI